ncbi:hypothetical protein [Mycoplasma buteonis]|uniref:hypothetical protein n=1 Tax=Mycoplasma buteonis TaxID=171280 RepID=UPI00056D3585|nr:hypothetical protein [Mycoplasma buteonis]
MSKKVDSFIKKIKQMHKGQKLYTVLWSLFVIFLITSVIIVAAYPTPVYPSGNGAVLSDGLQGQLVELQKQKVALINSQIDGITNYLTGDSSSITYAALNDKVAALNVAIEKNGYFLGEEPLKALKASVESFQKALKEGENNLPGALADIKANIFLNVKPEGMVDIVKSATSVKQLDPITLAELSEKVKQDIVNDNVYFKSLQATRANIIATIGLLMTIFMFASVITTVYVNGFVLKGKKMFRKAGN